VILSNGLVVNDEEAEFRVLIGGPSCRVFVSTRSRPGCSDVMAGYGRDGYVVAIHCVDGDHAVRAAEFVRRYRERVV
jgi:hypothetical protein